MNHSTQDEQVELQKYLEDKARQAQEKEPQAKPQSAYEACVLRESDKVRELMAEAKKRSKDE